jgi:hypothetical protein
LGCPSDLPVKAANVSLQRAHQTGLPVTDVHVSSAAGSKPSKILSQSDTTMMQAFGCLGLGSSAQILSPDANIVNPVQYGCSSGLSQDIMRLSKPQGSSSAECLGSDCHQTADQQADGKNRRVKRSSSSAGLCTEQAVAVKRQSCATAVPAAAEASQ